MKRRRRNSIAAGKAAIVGMLDDFGFKFFMPNLMPFNNSLRNMFLKLSKRSMDEEVRLSIYN